MKKGEAGDWNEAAASQRMPEPLEAVRQRFSPRASGGNLVPQTL